MVSLEPFLHESDSYIGRFINKFDVQVFNLLEMLFLFPDSTINVIFKYYESNDIFLNVVQSFLQEISHILYILPFQKKYLGFGTKIRVRNCDVDYYAIYIYASY